MKYVGKSHDSVKIMKALADEIRLGMVRYIDSSSEDKVLTKDIVGSCASRMKLSQPSISYHFNRLVEADILKLHKVGAENFYQINYDLLESIGVDVKKI